MLTLSNLKPNRRKVTRKRVGRGSGSGLGTFAGRGSKGQKARSGGGIKAGFEGGRMPLVRQMPKRRGFRSHKPKNEVLKLEQLASVFPEGAVITPEELFKKGLISTAAAPVKILGTGKISKRFELKQIALSAAAKKAVEEAGGKIQNVEQT